jgi:hypothetical protein
MRSAVSLVFSVALLVLRPASLLAQQSKPPSIQVLLSAYTFQVHTSQQWTDTGLDLERGDKIHITGTERACEGPWSGKEHLLVRSAPAGALLAKIDLDAAPIVASPDLELPILGPSHLYLGINAWQCHGTIPVKVQVEWHH